MALQIIGNMVVLVAAAFILGTLPLIDWLVRGLVRKDLSTLGTGNISVSAAFYHGGTKIGLLAVLSEALKGILVVLLARSLWFHSPPWEVVGLMALVWGRFTFGGGAGTTNVVWGYVAHDWGVALIVFLLSGGLYGFVPRRRQIRLWILVFIPLGEIIRQADTATVLAATGLSLMMAYIYTQIPDDLALSGQTQASSQPMFQYLKGQDVINSLDDKPEATKMGHKAATLAQLKRQGYAVPRGWILAPAADPRSLITHLEKTVDQPWQQTWIVRSSALDEDRDDASAAGQYQSIGHIDSPEAMMQAISACRASYQGNAAVQYRRDRGLGNQSGMALLVQKQIPGQISGVAFSRDPVEPGTSVVVEAIAGGAEQVVSGHCTPQQYQIEVDEATLAECTPQSLARVGVETVPSPADIPIALIQQAAYLARHLEQHYHGIPQDVEWSFDGETLWLLQSRPITTLAPIWTRKIAAEVMPGVIRPLTWSINRPLTCGVWGQIFTIVLGDRAVGLDFNETATLHYSRAYFNATLLGQIFRRMGLPAESLEFLTFGAKFSKPPLLSTIKNVPGLLRLIQRERRLIADFERDDRTVFAPTLATLSRTAATDLTATALLDRIDTLLARLETATYYSILAPLSFALRRSLFRIEETTLDSSQQPEVASIQAVKQLAQTVRQQHPELAEALADTPPEQLQDALAQLPQGPDCAAALDEIVQRYGYLSEIGTDIAVPTWREDPQPVQALFVQFLRRPPMLTEEASRPSPGWRDRQVQARLELKGRVATVYLRLLAELRWSLLAVEQQAIAQERLQHPGDGFFLTAEELRDCLATTPRWSTEVLQAKVSERRSRYEQHQAQTSIPFIVYGNHPPATGPAPTVAPSAGIMQGIGASVGAVRGPVKVLNSLQLADPLAPNTILVVPYTDAGWAPVLAQAAGLVAEVGGRLSHGAIVAREYAIPAVMNIADATRRFQDGQVVQIDGRAGTVEVIENSDSPAQ